MESECRMQRREALGEKNSEKFDGTEPCVAKKSSNYFWIHTTQKYDKFQKAQNTAEVTVLGFFKK